LVIGLYGEWGEGKSTVLNFVDSIFSSEYKDSVCCIRFNPWYFRNEDQLLTNFFEILASKLDERIKFNRERIGEFFKDYLAKLVPPTTTKFVGIDIGEMFNRWGSLISGISLDERKKRIEGILEEEKKKIVIMIDDIDRLDKNEIQTVLKLVKLLANFKHTTYILAFDVEMVATAISENYGDDKVAGKNFLEKIIQVPILLPKISRNSIESFCFRAIRQELELLDINLNDDEWLRFTENFEAGLSIRIQTIRMVKRYINALIFALPQIKNEVNIVDFLLLEGMRIFYPKLYIDIRENSLEYISSISSQQNTPEYKQNESNRLTEKWNAFTNDVRLAKNLLFCLFPNIRDVFFTLNPDNSIVRELVREDKLQPKQRVCSEEYFRRFFEYRISDSDISDVEMYKLFQQFTSESFPKTIESFFAQGKADTLLLKIRSRLKDFSIQETEKIAITLAEIGSQHLLNKNQKSIRLIPIHSLTWDFQNLVYDLVLELSDLEERFNLLQKVIERGNLIPFTINFFKYSITDESYWLSSERKSVLGQILATRVVRYFEEKSIFDYDEHFKLLIEILLDFGIKEENHRLFEKEIKAKPEKATQLLQRSCGVRPFSNDFNAFENLFNFEFMCNVFCKVYDLDIELKKCESEQNIPDEQKLVYNFLKRQCRHGIDI
jgi:predicted KAP-like P-loop ATPase